MTRRALLAVAVVLALSSTGCESRCTYFRCAEEPAVTWPRFGTERRERELMTEERRVRLLQYLEQSRQIEVDHLTWRAGFDRSWAREDRRFAAGFFALAAVQVAIASACNASGMWIPGLLLLAATLLPVRRGLAAWSDAAEHSANADRADAELARLRETR